MKREILENGGRLFYFPNVSMRYSFEGLLSFVPGAKEKDIIVADNSSMERRKILRLCPGGKLAILYLKTVAREKFVPLSDESGQITIKNLNMLKSLLLQLT